MKKKVKIISAVVAALLCVAAGIYYAMAPLRVEAVTLRPGTTALTFTESGCYDYDERLLVYPIVSGEVLEVRVEPGDAVKKGDVLAVVNASDYKYQIEQLKSSIAGYNGQIANVGLTEQQRRDQLNATIENLRGQLTTLEAEANRNNRSDESLEVQIDIQQSIVFQNRQAASSAKNDLEEARDWGYDEDVTAAKRALNAAENTLSQSELLLEQLKSGNVPADITEGQRQSLEAQLDSARAQLNKSYSGGMVQYYQAQIEAAQAGIAQMEEMAGKAELIAPIDGVVSELPVKDQNFTAQQQPAAVIGSGGRVEVYVPIREIDGVKPGDTVELILDKRLGKQILPGTVVEIGREAEARLSALGVEERKIRVLIRPGGELLIGYDMDVRFTVLTVENALIVPKTSVFDLDGKDFVWVIRDGVVRRQQIVKGLETRDGFVAESGLSEGDVVVSDADNTSLVEGKKAAGVD